MTSSSRNYPTAGHRHPRIVLLVLLAFAAALIYSPARVLAAEESLAPVSASGLTADLSVTMTDNKTTYTLVAAIPTSSPFPTAAPTM